MDTVLMLTHADAEGALPRAALEALTAARALAGGGALHAAVFGKGAAKAARALAGTGVARLLVADSDDLADARYATDAAAATALAKASAAPVVVVPGTSRMLRVVVLPAAAPGLVSAALVAVSRAVGETLLVTLLVGHVPRMGLDPRVAVAPLLEASRADAVVGVPALLCVVMVLSAWAIYLRRRHERRRAG